MAHIRIERLATGDDQEHGAEHRKTRKPVLGKERDGVTRIERTEDTDPRFLPKRLVFRGLLAPGGDTLAADDDLQAIWRSTTCPLIWSLTP